MGFYQLDPESQAALIAFDAIQRKPDDGPDFNEITERLARKQYERNRGKLG